MKKILILIVVLTVCNDMFAFTTQGNWRWRKDDGSQTTATWAAAQNTAAILTDTSLVIRLRIELFNDANNAGGLLDGALIEDSVAGGTGWDTIRLVPGLNSAFMLAGVSPNVTNLEATTQQLTAPHNISFVPGKVIVSSDKLPDYTVGSDAGTEYEYVIRPTVNIQTSKTYFFRIDAANYLSTLPLPSLTTASILPVKLTGFTVNRDDKKIKLEWVTASEQNNDRFEIQRSSDGKTWSTIAKVNGRGTTSGPNTYTATDDSPMSGNNYYIIRQYDVDGHLFQSAVKLLRMTGNGKTLVTVTPNPAHAGINFNLANQAAANVEAILTNVSGRIIYREIIKNIQANATTKLHLTQQPAPGVYILKLKAEGLSESIRVVID